MSDENEGKKSPKFQRNDGISAGYAGNYNKDGMGKFSDIFADSKKQAASTMSRF